MRRYLQFRLRSLFVLTTLAAVACVVVPPVVREYQRQRQLAWLQSVIEAYKEFPGDYPPLPRPEIP